MFRTLVDTNANGPDSADEVLTESWTDGAGRMRMSRVPHTWSGGSVATWAGTVTEYDILGRVKRQSVPTEVDSSWTAAGDDATRGFLWTYQKYDWKDRVVRKINTDGVDSETLNDSDILISYAGCGCAGGVETTVEGEVVPRTDGVGGNARRKQKIYQDILGRTTKTETFKWNGDVYLRTEVDLNGSDQAITVEQTDLNDPQNPVTQTTTMAYDGFGRLDTRHLPQQSSGTNTNYDYYSDGQLKSITDALDAVTNYTYNSRGLVTDIQWTVPTGSGITDPANVAFGYDNAGNRTSMSDGLGSVSYAHNSLSELTGETRSFSDTLANKPSGDYQLEYSYHLGGQLKSLTDPWDKQINYSYDTTGRLSTVAGAASYGGVTTYANNPLYRAWGGLKHLEYGNDQKADITYNNRLSPDTYNLQKTGSNPVLQKEYEYYNDGKIKFVGDMLAPPAPQAEGLWDRSMKYDHQGRVVEGKSSGEASGQTIYNWETTLPYRQSYSYNAFGNMTHRNSLHWGLEDPGGRSLNLSYDYVNNRVDSIVWTYDADGRVLQSNEPETPTNYFYDAGGQLTRSLDDQVDTSRYVDGYGKEGKRSTTKCEIDPLHPEDPCEWSDPEVKYYIRSSVLGGQVVSDVGGGGFKLRTYVHAAGEVIAWQNLSGETESVLFRQTDASGMSIKSTGSNGVPLQGDGYEGAPQELDPMGANVGMESPYEDPNPPEPCLGCDILLPREQSNINPNEPSYQVDGMDVSYSTAMSYIGMMTGWNAQSMLYQYSLRWSFDYVDGRATENPGQGDGGGDACQGGNCPTDAAGNPVVNVFEPQSSWTFVPGFFQISWEHSRALQDARQFVLDNAKHALSDSNNNCARVLKWAGLYNAVLKKLPDTVILSVSQEGALPAAGYFSAQNNETLRQFHERAFGPNAFGKAITSTKGILSYFGPYSFMARASDTRSTTLDKIGFFLHELVHHATGIGDPQLAALLLQTPQDGDTRTPADRLSDFFNNKCPLELAAPPPQSKPTGRRR